jgi:hypothetical protein
MIMGANHMYNVMPFSLRNTGVTYQRMMNKVFQKEIGDMLEFYMDDMIVKLAEEHQHKDILKAIFTHVRQ